MLTAFQLKGQLPAEKITELDAFFDEQYGPDQSLVNGARYYNMHLLASGHKFFGEDEFREGKLVLDNREYNDVFLKYNLYEQQIILRYTYLDQIYHEIIPSNSRIHEFELDGKVFRKCNFPGTDTLIYQIIEADDLAFYFHWSKTLSPGSSKEYIMGEFHQSKRDSYMLRNSTLHKFRGAKSFSKIFPEHQSEILKYIRKNIIMIKQATDAEMINLLRQCNIIIRG
ncbi:MAG TPA: hypothetical protein ENI20_12065 [Bacteroides sp.]|nr:hypothetical protein [Bacteroides sp.]